jgi:hypothetical protein
VGARWSQEHVRRVFWRAGFGATPREASHFARAGKSATLSWLLDGPSGRQLVGRAPRVDGRRLDPVNEYGHDVLWWLDRMVRSRRPLVERMTLFWHDHFATADQDTPLMLRQNHLLRSRGMGSFPGLVDGVMRDPAMQFFLSLADSTKEAPNENFARELVELFTLGGGYTEGDVREIARALTGWRSVRPRGGGSASVRWHSKSHDAGPKVIFGRRGRFGPRDVIELVTHHPRHAPFLVDKLWAAFTNEQLSSSTRRSLVRTYHRSDRRVKPVVAEILRHPALYASLGAPDMIKPPVVLVAGLLRTTSTPITIDSYTWLLNQMGQVPFRPPSVAGWDGGTAWLSTNAMRARVTLANATLAWDDAPLKVPKGAGHLGWNADQHVRRAHDAVGRPYLSRGTRAVLLDLARGFHDGEPNRDKADMLQRLLRHLMISGPDAQLH